MPVTFPKPVPSPESIPTAKVDTSTVLHQRMDKLADQIERGFAQQDANHDLLVGQVKSLTERVGNVEERVGRTSNRVRGESETNLEQQSTIGTLVTKVDAMQTSLATNNQATAAIKSAVVDGVKGFFVRHPKLETAFVALILAAIYWAITHLGGHV